MAEKDLSPLTQGIVRGLNDKLYDKRKTAALEIERMVKELVTSNDRKQVGRITALLTEEFAMSPNPNSRKGGLLGLAATAIALGKHINDYMSELVPPVLSCFSDPDSRIRYYACEALYNIAKTSRSGLLVFFNRIFDGLSKLAADPDPNVKNGAELLDRLLKDVVSESSSFDLEAFMDLLRERIYSPNPFVRQFLVSWVRLLDTVPQFDVIPHLPVYLDGMFVILGDQNKEIRKMCEALLGELLQGVRRSSGQVQFAAMINNLALHSQSPDKLTQFTGLLWMKEFLQLAGRQLLGYTPSMLSAILPCMAYTDDRQNIHDMALAVNTLLRDLITVEDDDITAEEPSPGSHPLRVDSPPITPTSPTTPRPCTMLQIGPVLDVLSVQLLDKSVATRSAGLSWLLHLHSKTSKKIFLVADQLFPVLLKTLSDQSDKVVLLALEVLAELSSSPAEEEIRAIYINRSESSTVAAPTSQATGSSTGSDSSERKVEVALPKGAKLPWVLRVGHGGVGNISQLVLPMLHKCGSHSRLTIYFTRLISSLLSLFSTDRQLLESRGSFIIRHLCLILSAKDVFGAFAAILSREDDLQFASVMVENVNMILLTSRELFDLRRELKNTPTKESCELFSSLYRSWCHNPVATLSLCLLTQAYEHATNLVRSFADLDITIEFLVELDRLVQLLESPIYIHVRLHLLEPQRFRHLVHTLYGILLLLPQSSAFVKLQERLKCIPNIAILGQVDRRPGKSEEPPKLISSIDFDELLDYFNRVQARHTDANRVVRFRDKDTS